MQRILTIKNKIGTKSRCARNSGKFYFLRRSCNFMHYLSTYICKKGKLKWPLQCPLVSKLQSSSNVKSASLFSSLDPGLAHASLFICKLITRMIVWQLLYSMTIECTILCRLLKVSLFLCVSQSFAFQWNIVRETKRFLFKEGLPLRVSSSFSTVRSSYLFWHPSSVSIVVTTWVSVC